jgi:peptidyl-tRNA hydrolase, PTH1 family
MSRVSWIPASAGMTVSVKIAYIMKIIVGLGNPEEKYDNTRHNLGFEVIAELASKLGESGKWKGESWQNEKKFNAEIIKSSFEIGNLKLEILLVKPQTYMNRSGEAVSKIANFYKVEPKDIIVIHDDLDLLLGKMKVRTGGGAGGHHGVESVIEKLGTDGFVRVRLGIGTDQGFLGEHKRVSFNAEHFVMEQFLPNQRSKVKSMIKHAVTAIETILKEGVEKAQNQFN